MNMSQGIGMYSRSAQVVVVGQFGNCNVCGGAFSAEGTACCTWNDCPTRRLHEIGEKLAKIIHWPCPKCSSDEVGVNDEDLYECRECHAQFTIGMGLPEWEETILIDPASDDIHTAGKTVKVHPEAGKGHFSVERELSLQMAFQCRRFNRLTKILRSLRSVTGCNDVTFGERGLSVDVETMIFDRVETLEAKDHPKKKKK